MTTQLTELQKQAVHYADIRKKLWGVQKPKPRFIPKKPEPAFIPRFFHLIPGWKKAPTYFDAHMNEWRIYLSEGSNPIKAYIRRRSAELGLTYKDIMQKSRKKGVVEYRQLIQWELKRLVVPDASYCELGRIFGLDHSTLVASVQKMDNEKVRALVGSDRTDEIDERRERRLAMKRAYNMRRKAEKSCIPAQS